MISVRVEEVIVAVSCLVAGVCVGAAIALRWSADAAERAGALVSPR